VLIYNPISCANLYDINYAHKKYRLCQLKSILLSKINNMKSDVIETIGYVVGFHETNIRLYLENMDIDIDMNLFSSKLNHLVETKFLDNTLHILSKETGQDIVIKIGQTVTLTLVITLKNIKKIKAKIISPNIQSLFDNLDYVEIY
jgi:hypothetical protein